MSAEAMSSPDLQKQAMGLISQAHNMCCLMESAVMGACERGLKLQGSTSRLAMVSLCVLLTLLREGLCTPPEGDPDDEGETEPTDGFGMGEGTGEKNVSDEIEDEEQLTGAEQQGESPSIPHALGQGARRHCTYKHAQICNREDIFTSISTRTLSLSLSHTHTHTQTHKHTNTQTNKQTNKQTNRHTNKQTNKQTNKHICNLQVHGEKYSQTLIFFPTQSHPLTQKWMHVVTNEYRGKGMDESGA